MTNEGQMRGKGEVVALTSQPAQSAGDEKTIEIRPKIYINGFPKAGTHLAVSMARSLVKDKASEYPWAGTFAYNAWSTQWLANVKIMPNLARLQEDTWLKGHCGYKPDIEQMLFWMGVSKVFVYRDLRDVLVSQSYHVLAEDDERYYHPNKGVYRGLFEDGGREAVLLACLEGVGAYAGLIDRWTQYAPWLHIPWVYKLRFEDAINEQERIAREFAFYVYNRMALAHGIEMAIHEDILDAAAKTIIKNVGKKDGSPTFRKGTTGQWRYEFTDKVKDKFKELGGGRWLIKLGYEENDDW